MTRARLLRRRFFFAAAALSLALVLALAACIIADPPTDLPRPTPRKPTIIRSTAVPPDTRVLGTFPDATQGQGFHVEVEADPTSQLSWSLYLDYDPLTNNGLIGQDSIPVDLSSQDAGIREVNMVPRRPVQPDPTLCHVVEGIVTLPQQRGSTSPHAYDPATGDSIVWFYSPTGDLSGCPIFTGGLDGAFRDVQPDALAIGDGGTE
jgi:hypothetical protein